MTDDEKRELIAGLHTRAKYARLSSEDAGLMRMSADALEARQVDEAALAGVIREVRNRSALIADVDLPMYIARAVVEFLGERHETEPVVCPNHHLVQHRDGKPPWCNACGRAAVPDTATKLRAERDAATAAIERVRAIHVRDEYGLCAECSWEYPETSYDALSNDVAWPCPTIAALDGAPEPEVNP